MKKRLSVLMLAVVCAQWLTVPALADPPHGKGRGKSQGHGPSEHAKSRDGKSSKLSLDDVWSAVLAAGVTQAYVRALAVNQGLLGYKPIPPGIRKNLARGKPLPRGVARKMIPNSLRDLLPKYRGYDWLIVGADLVLMRVASEAVAEVFDGVFK